MTTPHHSLPRSPAVLPLALSRSYLLLLGLLGTAGGACSSAPPPPTDPPAEASVPVATSGPPPQPAAPLAPQPRGETRTGTAAFIADRLNGRKTASGEVYDGTRLIVAHPTYPMGTRLRVTNEENGRTVEVTVVDRSAGGARRPIVDLSRAAAERLGFVDSGTVKVTTEVIAQKAP